MSSKCTKKEETEKKSKSKKDKKPTSSTKELKEKTPAAPVETPAATTTPSASTPEPELNDPDAVQLFRRYDREKASHITRSDFLELLQDYTTWYPGRKWDMPVMPCALTDAAGIPLGFERTARNSEFEAGQLFERYDSNRSGTLELKEFQVFYKDFKKQLAPFVEEMLSPRMYHHPPKFYSHYSPIDASSPWHNPENRAVYDSRHLYESKLAQLLNQCDTTLQAQRSYLQDKLENLRRSSVWKNTPQRTADYQTPGYSQHIEQQIQDDIDTIDRLTSDIKRRVYLAGVGNRASGHEISQFLEDYPRMQAKIDEIVSKSQPASLPTAREDERDKLLKVKDQMIWGLLQERNELRRQRDALDAQLRDVTELSAQEMRKWAKLTDDMQAEIERLRHG